MGPRARWAKQALKSKILEFPRMERGVQFKPNSGGRLASVAQFYAFLKNIVKHIDINIFQKHYQNIESWRKKHNVLHDVLDFRNSIQSYDKSMVKDLKTQKPIKHVERVCIALP